jgi:hypothetical protein
MVTETEVRSDFEPFFDPDGFIGPKAGQGSGNGLLYTAEYVVILRQLGFLKPADLIKYENLCLKCEISPGCYNRSPGDRSQEGPDDYTGVAAASPINADRSLRHGESNFWIYNNNGKGIRDSSGKINWAAFMGRFPSLLAHMKYGAGRKLGLITWLAWQIAVLGCALSDTADQDSWFLTWLLVHTGGQKSMVNRWISKLWVGNLRKQFPGGIQEVFEKYFGFQHPIAKYAQDI